MRMTREWIETHIPHQGRMCLLDEVLDWNGTFVRCRSATHRESQHPLRAHGRLGIACGIEYAAQAMAVHGALLQIKADQGFLISLRDVVFGAERLDDLDADLVCEATHLGGDASMTLYKFSLSAADRQLLGGRAAVVLDGAKRPVR
jgi:predicted hotdog family 3-hydroxylacyl-ACP dehydratase